MSTLREKIQNVFAAVSFAEVGEHETALRMSGQIPMPGRLWATIRNTFTAAAFAEADCPEMAREIMADAPLPRQMVIKSQVTLNDFAQAVGLGNIQFKFGVVRA